MIFPGRYYPVYMVAGFAYLCGMMLLYPSIPPAPAGGPLRIARPPSSIRPGGLLIGIRYTFSRAGWCIWTCIALISARVVLGWARRRAYVPETLQRHVQEVIQLLHASPHQAINRHRDHHWIGEDASECAMILLAALHHHDLKLAQALLRLHPGLWVVLLLLSIPAAALRAKKALPSAMLEMRYLRLLGLAGFASLVSWYFGVGLSWYIGLVSALGNWASYACWRVGCNAYVVIKAGTRDWRIWVSVPVIVASALIWRTWRRASLRQAYKRNEQEVNQLLHASPHQAINQYKDDLETIQDPSECAEVLFDAILHQDLELVQALLRLHPRIGLDEMFDAVFPVALDVKLATYWGGRVSLIHVACAVSLPIVKVLVGHEKAWRDMESEGGIRPLHEATARGDHELISYLLSMGANPSLMDAHDETPLRIAAQEGDMTAVRLLLHVRKKMECSCGRNWSSLGRALQYGHYDIAKFLLQDSGVLLRIMAGFSARHDKWCWDAMAVAVYHHEWRANAPELHIVESKDTAFAVLVMACAWGKPLAVEAALRVWGCTLLNKRDELKRQPLHVACLFGQLGIVRRLARYKELRVNDLEDEAGARRTALMIAAAEGHLEIVTFLVEHMKAKVGLKDAMGRTALDHAREGGKEDVVEYLSRPATSSKLATTRQPRQSRGANAQAESHKEAPPEHRSRASNAGQAAVSERAKVVMTRARKEHKGQHVVAPPSNVQRNAETSAKRRKHPKKKRAKAPQEPVQDKPVEDRLVADDGMDNPGTHWETPEAHLGTDDSAEVAEKQDDTAQVMEAEKKAGAELTATKIHASPDHLSCPISMCLLTDPMVAADNNTYQREHIEDWFHICDAAGRPVTSPLTGLPLLSRELKPNNLVKSLVLEHLRAMQAEV